MASCFVTTFKAIADLSKFEYEALSVKVEAILEKETGGYSITRVVVRPELALRGSADQERALRLLDKVERACLISRSIKSQIELQPTVQVPESEAATVAVGT